MARSKQNKKTTDGKHRKETKEEKRVRLQEQQEAREKCFQALPYVGGALFVFLVIFAIWVRSIPPKVTDFERNLETGNFTPDIGSVPEFMKDAQPMVKEALEEAEEVLKKLEEEGEEVDIDQVVVEQEEVVEL